MKRKTKALVFVSALLTVFTVAYLLSLQSYVYPGAEEVEKRLNYLERVAYEPLDENAEVVNLGRESQEFMLFSYSYTTYTATNLAIRDSSCVARVVPLIKESINKVLNDIVLYPYNINKESLYSDSIPNYSVLYLGHLNLMLGCYRLLSDDNSFDVLNDNISKSLFERYSNTSFMCLESYPFSIWIPDNTVALASLKLHDANTKSGYSAICTHWVEYAKANYIHSDSGVLYSTVDPKTGDVLEQPRGSMLAWSIMFIYQFDSEFAVELYHNYKKHFSDNLLVLRLFRERENSRDINLGDIDSGPIFLGYSIPANELALGCAILSEDFKTARKIGRLIGFGSKKMEDDNELKHRVRFVDMNISPMGEALVLYSMTIVKWTK